MAGKTKSAYQSLPPYDLERWVQKGGDLLIIDVLPPEQYARRHLPEAVNICVFDMGFLVDVHKLTSDRQSDIVVYGESWESFEAAAAAEKLVRDGYRNVNTLEGGSRAWAEAGFPLEGLDPEVVYDSADSFRIDPRDYEVDVETSRIGWTGRNINGSHRGTLRLSSGTLRAEDNLFSGTFIIDMTSITDTDIVDDALRSMLISHLFSDDFFLVEKFPTAEFDLLTARPIEAATPGSANFEINGSLRLRGRSVPIRFPATVAKTGPGSITADAHFDLDRTVWGIIYGSGKFFTYLGKHLVYDTISIDLRIAAA